MLASITQVIVTLAALVVGAQSPTSVERWRNLGRGEIRGHLLDINVDETWLSGSGRFRTAHWQLVFDEVNADGAKEMRLLDRVDCDRDMRENIRSERYSSTGQLLSRSDKDPASLKWEPIGDGLARSPDGLACIDGPGQH